MNFERCLLSLIFLSLSLCLANTFKFIVYLRYLQSKGSHKESRLLASWLPAPTSVGSQCRWEDKGSWFTCEHVTGYIRTIMTVISITRVWEFSGCVSKVYITSNFHCSATTNRKIYFPSHFIVIIFGWHMSTILLFTYLLSLLSHIGGSSNTRASSISTSTVVIMNMNNENEASVHWHI